MNSRAFAIVGKGGTGKTTFTHLLARALIAAGTHPLLVDADPTTSHLQHSFNMRAGKTIEGIRWRLIQAAASGNASEKERLAASIDQEVRDAVTRHEGFSMLVLGQPEGRGCFCPSNALLKELIEEEMEKHEVVLVDCEAGMEQINRKVIDRIDTLVIVCNPTTRSLDTAEHILDSAHACASFKTVGVVMNKTRGHIPDSIKERLAGLGVPVWGMVPDDPAIATLDGEGLSLVELPDAAPVFQPIREIASKLAGLG